MHYEFKCPELKVAKPEIKQVIQGMNNIQQNIKFKIF